MIATFINCFAVIFGSLLGIVLHKKIKPSFKGIVFTGIGIISLVLGTKMSLESTKIVYLALSLVLGGILGQWLDIEGKILKLGDFLKSKFSPDKYARASETGSKSGLESATSDFANGFLDASVIFCVGAMTLIGAFKAGTEGDYTLILTKSVLDGFMAIMLTAAMGIGVAFSAITILVYQGGLTLVSQWMKPFVTEAVLSEVTAVGGMLIIMIGINLLALTKLKTANFLPAVIFILFFLFIEARLPVPVI